MKAKTIIIWVIIVLLIGGCAVLWTLNTRIPKNPPGTVGNTAGNLNNNGLFCENDGVIYFSNLYDDGQLYSMTPNCTEIKELWDVPVKYINAGNQYLYYYQDSDSSNNSFGYLGSMLGVYRIRKNGKNNKCLDKTPSGIVNLINDTIFYQHYDDTDGMTLYQVDTDQTDKKTAVEAMINPACAANGVIYFANMEKNFYLSAYDTELMTISDLYEGKLYNPVLQGNYMYYMNVADDYALYRYEMTEGTIEKLTTDRVDAYNICNDYIYYQKNDTAEPALKRMRPDGSEVEIIAIGNYSNINITSTYTFFTAFNEDVPMYKTPTNGAVQVTNFDEAAAAVFVK